MDAYKKKGMISFSLISLLGLGLAQWGSYLVEKNLAIYQPVHIAPFLDFHHVRNLGGVFGLAQGQGWIFTVMSLLFLGGLCVYLWKDVELKFYEYLCAAMIMGGGMSNICDRFIYGSVIDFIDVKGIPGWHYIFNTADVMIHLGIWPWLLLGFWYNHKHPELKEETPDSSLASD